MNSPVLYYIHFRKQIFAGTDNFCRLQIFIYRCPFLRYNTGNPSKGSAECCGGGIVRVPRLYDGRRLRLSAQGIYDPLHSFTVLSAELEEQYVDPPVDPIDPVDPPVDPDQPEHPDTPDTGDRFMPALLLTAAVLSGAVLLLTAKRFKKHS